MTRPSIFDRGETKEHREFLSDDFSVFLRSSVVKTTAFKSKAKTNANDPSLSSRAPENGNWRRNLGVVRTA